MPNSGSFSALVWPTWWRWKVRDRLGIRIYRIYWVGHVSFVFENWWCDPKISQVQPVEVSEAVDAKLLSFFKIETLHTWCAFQKWIGLLTRRQWAQPIETSSANLSPLCHMPGVPEVWVFAEDARTTPEFGKSCFTRRPVYILHVALQKKSSGCRTNYFVDALNQEHPRTIIRQVSVTLCPEKEWNVKDYLTTDLPILPTIGSIVPCLCKITKYPHSSCLHHRQPPHWYKLAKLPSIRVRLCLRVPQLLMVDQCLSSFFTYFFRWKWWLFGKFQPFLVWPERPFQQWGTQQR